jgi:hypothetical protein
MRKFNLRPWYTDENIDKNTQYSRAIDGTDYLPGFIGLNNIKNTDYVNVIVQVRIGIILGVVQDTGFKRLFAQILDK